MSRPGPNQRPDVGQPPSLSARAAAALLQVNERTIRRAIARGELAARRCGASYCISSADLQRYAGRIKRPGAPETSARLVALPRADAVATMPAPLSSFVGRQRDLAAVGELLRDPAVRILTLTGPGGVGKTRLALAAAAQVGDAFADGAVFVGLATIDRPELVLPEIGRAFGLHDTQDGGLQARLRAYLRTKRLLLLLDNFEQVLPAASLVAQLAAGAPGVTVLVTSRAPLRLSGEREYAAPPLTLPDSAPALTGAALMASDAGQLFVERTRERDPSFTVDDAIAPVVADICARLDGLPLAIELAAAHATLLTPRELLHHLAPSLPLLTSGPRDAPERQRTLRNAIAWSYDLLTPEEQSLFRRLAVFAGGFTLEAAAWVTSWDGLGTPGPRHALASPSVLDLLGSLLDQGLLYRVVGPESQVRFRMLVTVQEFGLEQTERSGETAAAKVAHAHYMLHLARTLHPRVLVRATRAPLDLLNAEHANLLAALRWFEGAGASAEFASLAATLPSFWQACSRHQEGREWLRRALVTADAADPIDGARLQIGLAGLLTLQGGFAAAESLFARGLPILRSCAAPLEVCEALVWAGAGENFAGEYARGEALLHEAIALAERVDDPAGRAAVTANALANCGVSAQGLGDLERAAACHQAALDLYRRHDLDLGILRSHADMGEVARARGDARVAYEHYVAALRRADEVRDLRVVTEALIGVGRYAAALDEARLATRLLAAADAMREHHGTGVLFPEDVELKNQVVVRLRQRLGDDAFAATWAEGQALSRAEAVACAILVGESGARGARTATPDRGTRLSPRELDVLRLLVARRTNREIADVLFLSPRTVQWYVSGILGKLGAGSRRDAAAMAAAQGMV